MTSVIRRPAPFVLLSTGHGTLIVNKNDYCMIDDDRGYGVGYQLFSSSWFDPEEVDIVITMLRLRREMFGDGVLGIDCGANLGVHTVEWAKVMHGWGKVIAIEAQERIYYALAGNIAINNCFNASAIHGAVGANVGTLSVPVPNYLQPSSFGSLELRKSHNNEFIGQQIDYSKEKSETVNLISVDSLNLPRIDFIKIDVEGMELEVLAGAANSIESHHPIMLIESIKVDNPSLLTNLTGWGYTVIQVGINVLAIHAQDPCLERIKIETR